MNTFGIELDEVRAFLGLPNGSPTDLAMEGNLQIWLSSALAYIRQLTGRQLERALYRDTLDHRSHHFYLTETPIERIISLSHGPTSFNEVIDYAVFKSTGRVQFKNLGYLRSFESYRLHYDYLVIDYIGGYTTLPANLVMAALVGVQAAYLAHKQMLLYGTGIVKQISVIDVGSTTFENRTTSTSAALQNAISENLDDFLGLPMDYALGAPLLHESERLGDAPESPL